MIKHILATTALLAISAPANAQSMSKKFHTITVERELDHSAEAVWEAVAVDYGNIANTHPQIFASEYLSGSLEGELGAERSCAFDDKGKAWTHERIAEWDPENMRFVNVVTSSDNYPLDTDNTRGIYTVEALPDGGSVLKMTFEYRTAPAFLGGMVGRQFETLLSQYLLSVDYHLTTGNTVNQDTFGEVVSYYSQP
ncbi:MAG: hypothetical protein ACI8RZ_001493 [Myxococcota bacterium]|jgi:hypothetical protein